MCISKYASIWCMYLNIFITLVYAFQSMHANYVIAFASLQESEASVVSLETQHRMYPDVPRFLTWCSTESMSKLPADRVLAQLTGQTQVYRLYFTTLRWSLLLRLGKKFLKLYILYSLRCSYLQMLLVNYLTSFNIHKGSRRGQRQRIQTKWERSQESCIRRQVFATRRTPGSRYWRDYPL